MPANVEDLRLHGLLIRVPDLTQARAFYCGELRFKERLPAGGIAVLDCDPPVYFEQVGIGPAPAPDQARAFAALLVHNIDATLERFNMLGIPTVSQSGYPIEGGFATCFRDPFGNTHMIVQRRESSFVDEPSVCSVGLKVPIASVPAARGLYCHTLGFVVSTERLYPPSIPLKHRDGSFAFVIHDKQPWENDATLRAPLYPHDTGCVLVFETGDLDACQDYLRARSASMKIMPIEIFVLGRRMAFIDNSGIPSEIWERGR